MKCTFMYLVMFLKYMTEQKKIIRMMLYKHCFRLQYKYLLFLLFLDCNAPLSDPLVFLSLMAAFLLLLPEVWYIKSCHAFLEQSTD